MTISTTELHIAFVHIACATWAALFVCLLLVAIQDAAAAWRQK